MPQIQLPAIRLYYEEHGAGDPILCIHGTSSSAMVWGAAVEALARLGRVIVYDRRGCSRSQRPRPYLTTTVSEHADDAAALLEALAAIPATVVGRSYGGEVAIDLALRYPGRVRALVLLEAAILGLAPDAQRWADELHEAVRSAAATRGMEAVAEVFLRRVLGDATWEQFPAAARRMFADNGPAILAEFAGGGLRVDPATLARVQQPTLLVAAADSPAAFRQVTDAMAAAIPNTRTALVGGGHLVSPAEPAVRSFIQEVLARA
jgi:pimeloyl-ACP methyl ester carboxylesterase